VDNSVPSKANTNVNELISCQWDDSEGRHVKGLDFASLFYRAGELSLLLAVELVRKTVGGWDARRQ